MSAGVRLRTLAATIVLAVLTLMTLHFTVGASAATASSVAAGCGNSACSEVAFHCVFYMNHQCCFSGAGECTSISCLLSPEGCP
jgi:hypothetical protein